MKLNVLNVRTYNLNYFNRGSVFPQSFHLRVQLILDFLSCLPSALLWGTSMAFQQTLPLLRSFSPLVTDIPGVFRPSFGLAALYLNVLLSVQPDTPRKHLQGWSVLPCSWVLPARMETCAFMLPLGLLETSRLHKPSPALADGNQVCTTMSLHLLMLSSLFTQLLGWKLPQACYCSIGSGVSGTGRPGCVLSGLWSEASRVQEE